MFSVLCVRNGPKRGYLDRKGVYLLHLYYSGKRKIKISESRKRKKEKRKKKENTSQNFKKRKKRKKWKEKQITEYTYFCIVACTLPLTVVHHATYICYVQKYSPIYFFTNEGLNLMIQQTLIFLLISRFNYCY